MLIVDDRFGMSYEQLIALTEQHDGLSVVSITPYGLVGPRAHWRGSAATVSAYGGLTLYFGDKSLQKYTSDSAKSIINGVIPIFDADYELKLPTSWNIDWRYEKIWKKTIILMMRLDKSFL